MVEEAASAVAAAMLIDPPDRTLARFASTVPAAIVVLPVFCQAAGTVHSGRRLRVFAENQGIGFDRQIAARIKSGGFFRFRLGRRV